MLSYEVRGKVLTVVAKGSPSDFERRRLYEAIADDPRVPLGALVMLDVRRADAPEGAADIERRARMFVEGLGLKLGPPCAVIVPPRLVTELERFRTSSSVMGLRVQLFRDEPEAKQWLGSY